MKTYLYLTNQLEVKLPNTQRYVIRVRHRVATFCLLLEVLQSFLVIIIEPSFNVISVAAQIREFETIKL